jgi:ribonuclease HI
MPIGSYSQLAPQRKPKAIDYPEEDALNIYTDGSMLPTPRRGGVGVIFILINENGEEEQSEPFVPGYAGATNQQMELQACIEGLRLATSQQPPFERHRYRKIVVFTDSQYLFNHHTSAIHTWSRNGWRKSSNAPVDNAKQWKELVALMRRAGNQRKRVEIRWVPGKKTPRGKAVDKRAKASAQLATSRQLQPFRVRRKTSSQELERGSVKMEGQRLTIRITRDELLPQRIMKYTYEVLSKKSSYRGCRDVIYAEEACEMRAGHHYFVLVNDDTDYPRIVKVYREVER